jgi:hypothetical protein
VLFSRAEPYEVLNAENRKLRLLATVTAKAQEVSWNEGRCDSEENNSYRLLCNVPNEKILRISIGTELDVHDSRPYGLFAAKKTRWRRITNSKK